MFPHSGDVKKLIIVYLCIAAILEMKNRVVFRFIKTMDNFEAENSFEQMMRLIDNNHRYSV